MKNLDEKELKAINGGFIIWLLTSVAFSIIWETTSVRLRNYNTL